MSFKYSNSRFYLSLVCCLLAYTPSFCFAHNLDSLFATALTGSHRDLEFIARDVYRHPEKTLRFLGIKPGMTVVEIWPSRGWYTEILAPLLRNHGKLYVASFAKEVEQTPKWRKHIIRQFNEKLAAHPEIYDQIIVTELLMPKQTDIAPAGSADLILTFRNVHNWMAENHAQQMFNLFEKTLRPGGILGIVEHRALPGISIEKMIKTGYVTEEYIIGLAQSAGLILEAKSDINANPKDTKKHPNGVWSLPPSLRLCKSIEEGSKKNACRKKYHIIGESDRMLLKFKKPIKIGLHY